MAIKRSKDLKKEKEITPEIKNFIDSSPNEAKKGKDMLHRESFSFRINPDIWIDFEYHCKKQRISRSDIMEGMILEFLKKKKDDYR